jgi:predicted Rossmann fold flavoprotein
VDENCYHTGGGEDLSAFFARFSVEDNIRFWESRGVYVHDRNGYVYPRTEQASTIADAFDKILRAAGTEIIPGSRVSKVKPEEDSEGRVFRIETKAGRHYFARKVILSGGGEAGPQYGCDGSLYGIAESLGHTVNKPLPALVPLMSDDKDLKAAAGVRCDAKVTLVCGERASHAERGELQITQAGISGIPVFQISSEASRALDEGKKVFVKIDFLPDFTEEMWEKEKERRLSEDRNCMLGTFLLGLVNKKVLDLLLRKRGIQVEKKASKVDRDILDSIMEDMRCLHVRITGTGGFGQAQVTTGGIPLSQTDDDLMSDRCSGLYMAGELLDVDGICGGYNLQWAFTSGWIAGKSAAEERSSGK